MIYRTKLQEKTLLMYLDDNAIIRKPEARMVTSRNLIDMIADFRSHSIREYRDSKIAFRLVELYHDAAVDDVDIDIDIDLGIFRLILCYFLSMPDVDNPETICFTPDNTIIARWKLYDKPYDLSAEFMRGAELYIQWNQRDHRGNSFNPIDDGGPGITLEPYATLAEMRRKS